LDSPELQQIDSLQTTQICIGSTEILTACVMQAANIMDRTIEVARVLRWGSIALLALFLASVIAGLGPLLPDPAVALLRFCDRLVAHGALPVLALCLLALALLLDDRPGPADRLLGLVRRRAPLLALLWLLVVPLQLGAAWWHWRDLGLQQRTGLNQALARVQEARRRVAVAATLPELQRIHAELPPGAPPLEEFGDGLALRRSGLLDALAPVPVRLARESRSERWQEGFGLARRVVGTCLAAVGLAWLFHVAGRAGQEDLERDGHRFWRRRRPRRRQEHQLADYLEELAESATYPGPQP
jgi:hypothetical protein